MSVYSRVEQALICAISCEALKIKSQRFLLHALQKADFTKIYNLNFGIWVRVTSGRANNVITRLLQLSINPILVGGNSLLQQETKVSLTSLRRKTGLDFDNRGLKSDKV